VSGLVGAYQAFVAAARARGLGIYGAPILPFAGSQYDSADHETARQAVNAWIRTPGNFDAVLDFDAAVRDPANPVALLPVYESGDHLHLSVAGYERLADVVDLELFSAVRPRS
jgi:lysophospholipase L1-like esterase